MKKCQEAKDLEKDSLCGGADCEILWKENCLQAGTGNGNLERL